MRRKEALGVGETASFEYTWKKPFVSIFTPLCTWAAMSEPATIWVVSDVSLLQMFVS